MVQLCFIVAGFKSLKTDFEVQVYIYYVQTIVKIDILTHAIFQLQKFNKL